MKICLSTLCGFSSLPLIILALSLSALGLNASTFDPDAPINWEKEKTFWSFHPPKNPSIPVVKNKVWPRQEMDFFILYALEHKQLRPAPPAERAIWIRRVTFDLTGLPPTPAEVQNFLKDTKPGAHERVVDRLLDSPRYGERLTSLWLPLARYGEDQAHQVGNDTKYFYPNAFKYREWVIQAFNRDLPYNRFVQLQLAADQLSPIPTNDLAALGFLGLGPKYYNRDRLEVMADEWEDRVDTVTRTFLGLTVACARCHDHKFEPITRADYYGLAGIFASSKMVNQGPDGKEDKGKKSEEMNPATVHLMVDDKPQDLNIFIRGNVERKGSLAPRQFLNLLTDRAGLVETNRSGRLELAEQITDPKNPLTARVMVNRLWGQIFGRPLVETASNFGHSGQPPSHPELLEFLTFKFQNEGQSIKQLLRSLVLSATYRQSAEGDAQVAAADPANIWLGRMSRRRLSVEQWRDSLLTVAGDLDWNGLRSQELASPSNLTRTVYARISRLQLDPLLMQFDYPDANVHAEKRTDSTTAMQKLFALNSEFMLQRTASLANRIGPPGKNNAGVRAVYQLLFARDPDPIEVKLATNFLSRPANANMSRWEQYLQMLLSSNEMLYVD